MDDVQYQICRVKRQPGFLLTAGEWWLNPLEGESCEVKLAILLSKYSLPVAKSYSLTMFRHGLTRPRKATEIPIFKSFPHIANMCNAAKTRFCCQTVTEMKEVLLCLTCYREVHDERAGLTEPPDHSAATIKKLAWARTHETRTDI